MSTTGQRVFERGTRRAQRWSVDPLDAFLGLTPQVQRVVGWPGGECVRATYASILDLPYDAVPKLDPDTAAKKGVDQGALEREFLARLGLGLFEISVPPSLSIPQEVLDCIPEVLHLMSGISPRGHWHRVVGKGGRVLWDPHPDHTGLLTVYSVGFLIPLGESRSISQAIVEGL